MIRERAEEQIALLKAALAERDARLVEMTAQLAKLTEQVAKLTEVHERNSKNSQLPPSSDSPGSGPRTGAQQNRKSTHKRGGQKGHRGSYRDLLPPERVATFVNSTAHPYCNASSMSLRAQCSATSNGFSSEASGPRSNAWPARAPTPWNIAPHYGHL